jgi:hypothetical protein
MEAVVNSIDRNEHIAAQFMTNEQLREVALVSMMQEVYRRPRGRRGDSMTRLLLAVGLLGLASRLP